MRGTRHLPSMLLSLAVLAGMLFTSPAAHATTFGGNGRLVFVAKSRSGNNLDVWVANADGTGRKDLTRRSRANDTQATWSPEAGAHIAFVRKRDIWRMNNDGSDRFNITKTSSAAEFDPAWSPGGGKLAFARRSGHGDADVWRITLNGFDPFNMTKGSGANDIEPAWSPDQLSVAFVSNRGGGYGIYTTNVLGGNVKQLTSSGRSPNWAPDGSKIVFERDGDIWAMDANGSNERRLTNHPDGMRDSDPAWAPSQSRIVFQRGAHVVVMRPDGSHQKSVKLGIKAADPDWQAACTIKGTDHHDVLYGTPGRDLICWSGGGDTIYARGGDDIIFGGTGSDAIYGGGGDDYIQGGGSRASRGDKIYGGPGNDLVQGSQLGDVLSGGGGSDRIQGELGSDRIRSGDGVSGNDVVNGGPDSDHCTADSGDKVLACP